MFLSSIRSLLQDIPRIRRNDFHSHTGQCMTLYLFFQEKRIFTIYKRKKCRTRQKIPPTKIKYGYSETHNSFIIVDHIEKS